MTSQPLRVWYVAGQRLCNLDCTYCVSTGDWAKSRKYDWRDPRDRDTFAGIVKWLGTRPFPVELRLGSLGEPFASPFFLEQAGWLTRQPGVRYVELVSNGVLLQRRLPAIEACANLGKLSLWLTWHEGQVSMDKFISAAAFAQDAYGCFVVVNALLFSGSDTATIRRFRDAAADAGLRCNVDLGYDPTAPSQSGGDPAVIVPLMRSADVLEIMDRCGGDRELTEVALTGLTKPLGLPCRAGHDYIFVDIHGQVYQCSRYSVLDKNSHGNVLDPEFTLDLRAGMWAPCAVASGCCNKEDFLNLQEAAHLRVRDVPSLGWTDA